MARLYQRESTFVMVNERTVKTKFGLVDTFPFWPGFHWGIHSTRIFFPLLGLGEMAWTADENWVDWARQL